MFPLYLNIDKPDQYQLHFPALSNREASRCVNKCFELTRTMAAVFTIDMYTPIYFKEQQAALSSIPSRVFVEPRQRVFSGLGVEWNI